MKKIILLLLFLIINISINANEFCNNNELGKLAVLSGGRIKPFLVHAKDRMLFVTSDKSEVKKNGLVNFCLLALATDKSILNKIKIKIYNNKIKKILNMDVARKSSYLTLDKFLNSKMAITHINIPTSDKRLQNIMNVYFERMNVLKEILDKRDFKINIDGKWLYPAEVPADIKISDKFAGEINFINGQVKFEYYYTLLRPFSISIILIILALFLMVLRKNIMVVVILSCATLDIQLLAIISRGYIAGRIPLSNMYETVMFAGFAANILGLIFYYFRKQKILITVGLLCNFFALFMLQFATDMLDSSIRPLMPVLKNNFWLGIHVFTVIVAYASFGASWLISNYILLTTLFKNKDNEINGIYYKIISDCLRVGVVFLSVGILTGGMWADFAWGRFWGWDPKEVWSLIVLLVYMIILHGRYTNWISKRRFVFLTAPAFLSVMMAWFGVNYVLATGLHSYGFSQGGTIFFVAFVGVQLLLSAIHGIMNKN